MDELQIGPRSFRSRLLLGTGKFADHATMLKAIAAAGAELVTVALRRFNRERPEDDLCAPLARIAMFCSQPLMAATSSSHLRFDELPSGSSMENDWSSRNKKHALFCRLISWL